MTQRLARPDAALQRRGPHPLPMFLGMAVRETGGDRARMAAVLRGVRAYQTHPHARAAEALPQAARAGACRLVDHGGAGPPVVLVPSLINEGSVLDLAPGASLAAHLRARGLRPLRVDWGAPGAEERAMDVGALVTGRLLPMLAALGEPVMLAGYCLGGTIALAAAALAPPVKLALIATPWRFGGYPRERRAALADLWSAIEAGARAEGEVAIDLLQPGFWDLDPASAVAKFERFGGIDPAAPEARHYVVVEDWVNGGPPIGVAAAADIFERFFAVDEPGRGEWRVGGRVVDPAALTCPVLNLVAARDRLVPAEAAARAGERRDLDAGHVGMMVGRRARDLLHEPLARWLQGEG